MDYLVFDVGGSAIKYALMSEKAEFINKGKVKTPLDSTESLLETIESIYSQYKEKVQGVGVSLPGRIDSESGYAFTGGYLEYNAGKNMISLLEERCLVPVTVENDGKCAALAEAWKGSLSDCINGVVVVLGTGIGGGVIINKKLYKGSHFQAGEFSNIITNDEAKPGEEERLWWYYGATSGLCQLVARSKNLSCSEINGLRVFEMVNQKDSEALNILDEYCRKLVIQLFNLQYCFDPEKIAIGGGISSQDSLFEYIQRNVEKYSLQMPEGFVPPQVVRCRFESDANMIGALYCYLLKQGKIDSDNNLMKI